MSSPADRPEPPNTPATGRDGGAPARRDGDAGTRRTEIMASLEALASPWAIGDHEIVRELGRGGMGVVYEARSLRLGRRVALKVMLRADAALRARFEREARALALVDSPHVVAVHEAGQQGDDLFFAMEYISGRDLARRLADGWRPSHREALELTLQAARGLAAAARHGLVHRDIKPGNLMLADDGTLKLMDFGLVRMAREESLTNTGVVVGTVAYFSPEQGAGGRCDHRSDLYSLGVVFFELLTGRTPFDGDTAAAIIYQHIHAPPPRPRALDRTIPPEYEAIALRCLEKRPERRYADADALIADLERARDGGRIARPRRPAATIAAAIVAAAIVVGIARVEQRHAAARRRAPAATVAPAAPPPAGIAAAAVDDRGTYADLVVGDERLRFRWCAPGGFVMGADTPSAALSGAIAHRVTLTRGFWIAETETTAGLWSLALDGVAGRSSGMPVHDVSRDRCLAFVAALRARVPGLSPRLPTEAEWEYACRAGAPLAPDERVPGFYDAVDEPGPHPVRSAWPCNRWGLWDCAGNVSEWCADAWTSLGRDPVVDPLATDGDAGVLRGGCWLDRASDCRPWSRERASPSSPVRGAGLRLALDAAK